ncbi:CapA family protein [Candidatus Merdisoma sp. HCP28S3_D10]|uniref:CapA family protein n=1 Tax=unclassified Candidatus Merdisoma TaxID=3099611 RepID=UPI003F8B31A8
MAGRKGSFFSELLKYISVSILAVFTALLVGGVLWAAEGFSVPGKSGETLADAKEEGKLSVEVPTVQVVQPAEKDNAGENPDAENPDVFLEEEAPNAPQDTAEPKENVTLLFAGDLFLTDILQEKYDKNGASAAAAPELLSVTRSADIFMLNQEFPFGTTGEAVEDKEYTFRVDPKYVSLLPELGVDVVTLANNHMLDYGRGPLKETLEALDEAGILHVGAGQNLEEASALKTIEAGGWTIGFLGATRVIPEHSWTASWSNSGLFTTYDPTKLLGEIQAAKQQFDYVVVYVHWGIERNTEPEEYQKSLARQYIDAGADAVIGAHPHVLQGIEYYQGKPIFYSLGNFIFANRTYETMMAELTITDDGIEVRVIPCVSTANQMGLMDGSGRAAFYGNLQGLCFGGVTIGEDGSVRE